MTPRGIFLRVSRIAVGESRGLDTDRALVRHCRRDLHAEFPASRRRRSTDSRRPREFAHRVHQGREPPDLK